MRRPDRYSDLRERIKKIFAKANGCYGYRRIHAVLKHSGTTVSEKVIRRFMGEEGLHVIRPQRRKYSSYMGEISPAVPNILNREFHADKPNQKWFTDITEFHIPAGKIYLSPIVDCFDGMAVAWSIGTSPNAKLVNSMLEEAVTLLREEEHPRHTLRPRRTLPLARLDRADGKVSLNTLHVKEGLFSRQCRL